MKTTVFILSILFFLTSLGATADDLENEVIHRREERQAAIREQVEARAKSRLETLLRMAGFGELQVDQTSRRDLCWDGGNGPGTACFETYEFQMDVKVKDTSGMICIGPVDAQYVDGKDNLSDWCYLDCTDSNAVTRRYSL